MLTARLAELDSLQGKKPLANLNQKKALKKGEYLQGSNAVLLARYGPAQGGEAGGKRTTCFYESPFEKKFHLIALPRSTICVFLV